MADQSPTLKRKVPDDDEAEVETKRQRTAQPPKPPASFLTLPSELRQAIILLTHRSLTLEYILRASGHPEFRYVYDIFCECDSDIHEWTDTLLEVDVETEDDVLHVFDKCSESLLDVEKEWEDQLDLTKLHDIIVTQAS